MLAGDMKRTHSIDGGFYVYSIDVSVTIISRIN